MTSILDSLNERQLQAVTHVDGPILIIAGAGSGKTKALTHRIAYLIEEQEVKPGEILAVTFTNKAANEMKERVGHLIGESFHQDFRRMRMFPLDIPVMGTFHSICVRILRLEMEKLGRGTDFVIYDTTDTKSLMRKILKDMNIDEKQFPAKTILAHISSAKNELIDEKKYASQADNYYQKNIARLYEEYQKQLQENNAVDFDDLMFLVIKLFGTNPETLSYYQQKWKYVCVDEYQDTNFAQYLLIRLLTDKHKNLCVIGDSDQSIYSFRGADIRNILNFERDYPNAKVVKLEQNYRSTQNILDAADSVIEKNTNRPSKKMWTERGEGGKIHLLQAYNERDEASMIAKKIKHFVENHDNDLSYKDFVILYRTNAQSRILEESMMQNAISYKVIGGVKFYERREVKDVLAYMRCTYNPEDTISMLRIINVPSRKIGQKTLQKVTEYASAEDRSFWYALQHVEDITGISTGAKKSLKNFVAIIEKFQEQSHKLSLKDLIDSIMDVSGYRDYLVEDGSVEGAVRLENVMELSSVAKKYDGLEPRESLTCFLEEVALVMDADSTGSKEDMVTLMTIHTAKGLEFPYVFIVGCEEGIFPHSRSLSNEEDIEEERRLMYVAMTRASVQLYLMCAHQRTIFGDYQKNMKSRFLNDIPLALMESNIDLGTARVGVSYNSQDSEYGFDVDSARDAFHDFDFNQDY